MLKDDLKFSTNFLVMPADCNDQIPMIFGGKLFSELDKACDCVAKQALRHSICEYPVTYDWAGKFLNTAWMGEIVYIDAEIIGFHIKSIKIKVRAYKKEWDKVKKEENIITLATGEFIFISKIGKEYVPHGLSMPTED